MRTLDDTDREILRLLLEDARRPFSDIAEHVDLSAPAVSDRVDRLREIGVVEGFTLRLDESAISAGVDLLIRIDVAPAAVETAREGLVAAEAVEHTFVTADGELYATAAVDPESVRDLVDAAVGLDAVRDLDVSPLDGHEWTPSVGDADLAVDCVECGNTVTEEGESARIDGTLYHFCCGSCLSNFEARYDRLQEGA